MNNSELDNTRPDGADEARDREDNPENKNAGDSSDKKESGAQTFGTSEKPGDEAQSAGNIFAVGGQRDGGLAGGEYSYGKKEQIPEYKYAFTPSGQTPSPAARPKRGNSGRAALITALVVAAVMLAALAGFGGAMLAQEIIDRSGVNTEVTLSGSEVTETTAPTEETPPDGGSVIMIKNNGSANVETVSGKIGDGNLTIPDVVALVKDSVVEISTETGVYNGRYVVSGAGSGVIIGRSEDGKTVYVVTNNHVIEGADSITVRLTNGNKYTATLRVTDSTSDLAVLVIAVNEEVTVAQLGSSASLRVGDGVIAIGNPLGELGGTVTNGIISALAREVEVDGADMTLLQISAAVNPGNSGGGLFNMRGELIGVVNAKSSGADIDNIGFAIPVDTAYDVISELIEYGYVTGRVDAGLTLIDVTDNYTAWYYGVSALGVYVYESKYSDEIKSGDRVVSVNGVEVSSSADVKSALGDCAVGDTVTVRVSRKGKQYDISLTLREYVPSIIADGTPAVETTASK